jgi:hypothetical protein
LTLVQSVQIDNATGLGESIYMTDTYLVVTASLENEVYFFEHTASEEPAQTGDEDDNDNNGDEDNEGNEDNEVSNIAVELTDNNLGKTFRTSSINKSIGYSTSVVTRTKKENTIGNYHNVASSRSRNNIKAKSYSEYIAFLKARNRMNLE